MKKKIMIGLSAFVLLIGGIFLGGKVAGATVATNDQKMKITIDGTEQEVFNNTFFELELNIDGGAIDGNDNKDIESSEIYLNYEFIPGLELIDIDMQYKNYNSQWLDKEVSFENNKINMGRFKYIYNKGWESNPQFKMQMVGPEVKLKLKYKVSSEKDINLKDKFTLKYKTLPYGSNVPIEASNKFEKDYNLKVSVIEPEIGFINPGNNPPTEVIVNNFFDLNYKIEDISFSKITSGNEKLSLESFEEMKARSMVYVVDKSAIDLVGGNDEIARDSIKKSLEELKKTNPDTKTSLVTYGKKTEIVSVDDKTLFSIDELIAQIGKIEAEDKSGNLGDAIRKAKYLSNENTDSNSSIIVVSNGNPNYYTQVSQGNIDFLETRANKDGFVVEDKDIAIEYVNTIVNDIAINEIDETRWYGINYAIEQQELLLNDSIDKLDGNIANIKNPYYDDFTSINTKAINSVSIKAKLTFKSSDNSGIVVHDDYKEKEIELDLVGKDGKIVAKSSEDIIVKVKVDNVDLDENGNIKEVDVANPEILEVKLELDYNNKKQSTIFNTGEKLISDGTKVMDDDFKLINWNVKATIPYISEIGLFNNNFDLIGLNKDRDTVQELVEVNFIAQNLLDSVSDAKLAVENYYSFGCVLKPKSDTNIKIIHSLEPQTKAKIYKMNKISGKIDKGACINIDNTSLEVPLTKDEIYLITIDDYIENNIFAPFKVGISIKNNEMGWDDRTINIIPVAKAEHF